MFGCIEAKFLWEYLYAIGARVISDGVYEEHIETVWLAGLLFGGITALIRAVFPQRGLFLALFLQHVLGILAGFLAASSGWIHAIGWYFGVQLLVWGVSCGVAVLPAIARRAAGRA